ncbi:MAG: hypothetical protein ACU83O_10230 [Gammaproteobacteria bacterium]
MVLAIFAIAGFGPISLTCLVGFYIVAMRPLWFFDLVGDMYDNPAPFRTKRSATAEKQAFSVRIKCFLTLLALFLLDIAPIPITSPIAILIVLIRPTWFQRVVLGVYGRI